VVRSEGEMLSKRVWYFKKRDWALRILQVRCHHGKGKGKEKKNRWRKKKKGHEVQKGRCKWGGKPMAGGRKKETLPPGGDLISISREGKETLKRSSGWGEMVVLSKEKKKV